MIRGTPGPNYQFHQRQQFLVPLFLLKMLVPHIKLLVWPRVVVLSFLMDVFGCSLSVLSSLVMVGVGCLVDGGSSHYHGDSKLC